MTSRTLTSTAPLLAALALALLPGSACVVSRAGTGVPPMPKSAGFPARDLANNSQTKRDPGHIRAPENTANNSPASIPGRARPPRALPSPALPPALPSALHPAHNSSGIVQHPSFTWEPEPGAAAYEIEIAADYDYKKVVVPVTRVETPRFVPLKPLYPATRFWRTRALAADGRAGPWSATRVYKLHAPAHTIAIPAGATLEQIRATIDAAPASSLITFAPNTTYRLKPAEGDYLIMLEKRDDLILDGNDSLFIIQTPTAGAIRMNECRRVTFRRFRFDYDPLPHSIGAVESVNPAPANEVSTVTLRRLPGYPDFDAPHMLA
ncbi:MAG: hypothetical protein LBI02_04115, partial [Opitutaceae bacterium]|nr:hypothetical protein [Opitutaceae bacterium]